MTTAHHVPGPDPIEIEAQRIVLCSTLTAPDRLEQVADLPPEAFPDERLRAVFQAIKAVAADGQELDSFAVSQRLNGRFQNPITYLEALKAETIPRKNLSAYRDLLLEKHKARTEAVALKHIAAIAQRGDVAAVKEAVSALDETSEQKSINPVFPCQDFLEKQHGSITPLIGTENDSLLVRGEGMFNPGQGGVGKTLFITQLAINLTCGEYFLKWPVPRPFRVLISQAELPPQFFQKRLRAMFDSYALADQKRAKLIAENLFIEQVLQPFDIAAENGEGLDRLAGTIEKLKIDVLIVDPFLSYFRGNENDNCEVRRALDNFKRQVAERCQCGLVITDHQPKYSTSDKNKEQASSMRGAGAKRDWAASVIALAKMKTPEGQHGTFIQATVDKIRYGKAPRNPFSLRRDDLTFRHSVFKSNSIELHEVARVLDEAGGGLSTRAIRDRIVEEFAVADHEARLLVKDAIDAGWIETKPGEKRSTAHHLTIKYIGWRDGRQ